MTADMKIRSFSASLEAARVKREEWMRENPTLAADWDAALEESAARADATRKAAAAAKQREAVLSACEAVGMPQRALAALQKPKVTEAMEAMRSGSEGRSVILLAGPPGTGKSVAAVDAGLTAMTAAMATNPERVSAMPERVAMFVRAVTVARASAYGAETQALMDSLCSTRLLVIDDLGAEFASPVWDMLLFEIVDTRHGAMLPTILTSNLGKEDFVGRYGLRLIERIRETGRAVFLNGTSMRGQP